MASADRYPRDTALSPQDVDTCGWKDIVGTAAGPDYAYLWIPLATAAQQASHEGRFGHARMLYLLSDALSMRLVPSKEEAPFEAMGDLGDRRTALPEDFSEEDIDYLSSVVEKFDDPRIRGRIADLVWVRKRSLGPRNALVAIDAYMQLPITRDTWVHDTAACWRRALTLAQKLKGGAGDRAGQIEASLLAAFFAGTSEEAFYPLQVARLMLDSRVAKAQGPAIAGRLAQFGTDAAALGRFYPARAYSEAAAEWFARSGDRSSRAQALAVTAKAWVDEVDARMEQGDVGGILGLDHYHKAIETYRAIARADRLPLQVDQCIADLELKITQAGERALAEMTRIETPGLDVSGLRADAVAAVTGHSPNQAIANFALRLHPGGTVARYRAEAEATLRGSIHQMFPAMTLDHTGRVIAKHPGITFEAPAPGARDPAVWMEMIRNYQYDIGLSAVAQIGPALARLKCEHSFTEWAFIDLAQNCPIVPRDHAVLIGKALFAGYSGEFGLAVHVLAPQIEHLVRTRLKREDIKTTTLSADGVENEVGLASLVEKPEVTTLFGADLAFELEALFCDARGPNLRNQVAHGLLTDRAAHDESALYAWWFTLHLIVLTIVDAHPTPERQRRKWPGVRRPKMRSRRHWKPKHR